MLGKELELLVKASELGYIVTADEAERVRGRYTKLGPQHVNPRPCESYMTRRFCRFGDECHFIHMIEEKDCKDGDKVYGGFIVSVR